MEGGLISWIAYVNTSNTVTTRIASQNICFDLATAITNRNLRRVEHRCITMHRVVPANHGCFRTMSWHEPHLQAQHMEPPQTESTPIERTLSLQNPPQCSPQPGAQPPQCSASAPPPLQRQQASARPPFSAATTRSQPTTRTQRNPSNRPCQRPMRCRPAAREQWTKHCKKASKKGRRSG